MSGKEFFTRLITTYFILVTLIDGAILLLGLAFDPEGRYGYEMLLSPLAFAAAGILPSVVTYSRRELSIRAYLLRKALQLLLIEALVLLLAWRSPVIETNRPAVLLALIGSICLVFLLANGLVYLLDRASARQMTRDLMQFQRRNEQ